MFLFMEEGDIRVTPEGDIRVMGRVTSTSPWEGDILSSSIWTGRCNAAATCRRQGEPAPTSARCREIASASTQGRPNKPKQTHNL
jgi:hypothetical protein